MSKTRRQQCTLLHCLHKIKVGASRKLFYIAFTCCCCCCCCCWIITRSLLMALLVRIEFQSPTYIVCTMLATCSVLMRNLEAIVSTYIQQDLNHLNPEEGGGCFYCPAHLVNRSFAYCNSAEHSTGYKRLSVCNIRVLSKTDL